MVKKHKGASQKVMDYRIKLAMRGPTNLAPYDVIRQALKRKCYVAWSGGRCSTVALHFVLKQAPDIPVAFTNTGVEYPETVKYVRRIADEWDINFHELRPVEGCTFWTLVEKYGFPQLRGSAGKGKKRPRRPMCCKYLKEDPGKKFLKENELDGLITGLRVEESRARALAIFQKGQFYDTVRDGARARARVGCLPCTGFTTWREQLSKHRPRFFKWFNREYQKSIGEPTLWEFKNVFDICEDVV